MPIHVLYRDKLRSLENERKGNYTKATDQHNSEPWLADTGATWHCTNNRPFEIVSTLQNDKILKEWQPEENSPEWQEMNHKPVPMQSTNDPTETMSKASIYRAICGSLLWISRCTRGDISWITSELCRHMK